MATSQRLRSPRRKSSKKLSKRPIKKAKSTATLIDQSGAQPSFIYSAVYQFLFWIYGPIYHFRVIKLRWQRWRQYATLQIKKGLKKIGIIQFFWRDFLYPIWFLIRHRLLVTLLVAAVCVGLLSGANYIYDLIFKDLPQVTELNSHAPALTTKILDRNGKLLYQIYKDENRVLVPLNQISPYIQYSTIAIEDKDFFNHRGFSIQGITRAARNTLQGGKLEGGSTITQQLVKKTLLSDERTLRRKIREILLSIVVENQFTKEQILELYFNQISYGGSVYGIEAAAQRYFGKPASKVTLAEAALLSGLPAAPSIFSPYGANPELAVARQHEVLRRMVEDGYITEQQAEEARNQPLQFQADTNDIRAPHFVMYVRDWLAKEYGDDVLNHGGLEVRTSLDLELQDQTQQVVTEEVDKLRGMHINNGAALVTNPKTGEILAMIGSKDYFDVANDGQVNVTLRPRQPGSSIKPLTYAIAFEQGKNPSSMILDEPISYNFPGSPVYTPKNYDGKFHGNVTIRESLGSSYNIPAVKTLASIGLNALIDKGQQMGITSWEDRRRFGLSLTLGSGEVKMTEMAQVYGTFANYGRTVQLNPILEIKNRNKEVIYENRCVTSGQDCPSEQTLKPQAAYQITSVLIDNQARIPAFGPRSVLYIPDQEVAVKTGTTNNLRDNWSIGYTSDRLVAVWVGNNDNTPMSYVASGITGASPIWNKIFRQLLTEESPHRFAPPSGFVKVRICNVTRTLTCTGCPQTSEEIFVEGQEPRQACTPEQVATALRNNRPTPSPTPSARPTASPTTRGRLLPGRQTIRGPARQ